MYFKYEIDRELSNGKGVAMSPPNSVFVETEKGNIPEEFENISTWWIMGESLRQQKS